VSDELVMFVSKRPVVGLGSMLLCGAGVVAAAANADMIFWRPYQVQARGSKLVLAE